MRTICVITGTRAEYGLLYWLLKEIENDSGLELQIVVTGMHLSPEFGLTWQQIEKEGFKINRKVEMLLSSDTPTGISKSIGLGMIGFADAFTELKPDIIVVLGDRFEIISAAISALVARIPIAHLHGGEVTEGAVDEAIRHSITKMSHLHFAATDSYRKRVIQLGESPDRVFNVGGMGIDSIKRTTLLNKVELEKEIGVKLKVHNLMITFHPATLENNTAAAHFAAILNVLDELKDTQLIFTKPNADTNGRVLIKMIDDYVGSHLEKAVSFASMGRIRYYSALQFVDGVIGNSSSGILEAPTFKIGTINIGDRQKGRLKADSVIDCNPDEESIHKAFEILYSREFQERLRGVTNPYGDGNASNRIKEIVKTYPLEQLLKKSFHDL